MTVEDLRSVLPPGVYLKPEEVAQRLHLNIETIYRWLRSGKLEGFKINRKVWRIPESFLDNFMTRHRN